MDKYTVEQRAQELKAQELKRAAEAAYLGGLKGCENLAAGACEPDTRWVLQERVYQLRAEADALQGLLDALPAKLPYAAQRGLTVLLEGGRR